MVMQALILACIQVCKPLLMETLPALEFFIFSLPLIPLCGTKSQAFFPVLIEDFVRTVKNSCRILHAFAKGAVGIGALRAIFTTLAPDYDQGENVFLDRGLTWGYIAS